MSKPLRTEVTMSEFRDNLSAYLDAAESGKTITITRRGRPSATLAAAGETADAIDLDALRMFRESLEVRAEESVIISARQDERY